MNWSYIEDTGSGPSAHASGGAYGPNSDALPFISPASTAGTYVRREGQVIYSNGNRVITVSLYFLVNHDLGNLCEVTGTALPAALK